MDESQNVNVSDLLASLLARVAILEAREEILRGTFLSELKRTDPDSADFFENETPKIVAELAKEKALDLPLVEALFLKHIRDQLGL